MNNEDLIQTLQNLAEANGRIKYYQDFLNGIKEGQIDDMGNFYSAIYSYELKKENERREHLTSELERHRKESLVEGRKPW
jgi:hypothetical protein